MTLGVCWSTATAGSCSTRAAHRLDAGHLPRPSAILDLPRGHLVDVLATITREQTRAWIEAGYSPAQAREMALRRSVLAGQQLLVDQANYQAMDAARTNRRILQGHRRIATAGACGFCRRLAGAAERYPVYNVTTRWYRPHPNCHCVLVPLPLYGFERTRSPAEIAAGQAMYRRIKAGKDRARARQLRTA